MEGRKPHFDLVALCPGTVYGAQMQVLHSLNDLDSASASKLKTLYGSIDRKC